MFKDRPDKVVGIARVLLGVASARIAWLNSRHPDGATALEQSVAAAYLVYALLTAAAVWRTQLPDSHGTALRHALDLTVLATLVALSGGTESPYFMFVPFILINGMLCWRWQGAVWTSAALGALLCLLLLLDRETAIDPDYNHTIDVSRTFLVVVSAGLMLWLGLHEDNIQGALRRLTWRPAPMPTGRDWPGAEALDYAAHVTQASRLIMLWNDPVEPLTHVARWEHGASTVSRVERERYAPWTAASLAGAEFVAQMDVAGVLALDGAGVLKRRVVDGPAVNPRLAADSGASAILSVPIPAKALEARLFLLDPSGNGAEQVAVAEVVAGRIGQLFEQALLTRRMLDEAELAQRSRVGRDLHDGVLQTLAGTSLQLEALVAVARQDPELLEERIRALQTMLSREQRALRELIDALELGDDDPGEVSVAPCLHRLAARSVAQWRADVRVVVTPEELRLPARLVGELGALASEAIANAVKHGKARRIDLSVRCRGGEVALAVADDGCGFRRSGGPAGSPDADLTPKSLRARTQRCGGLIAVHDRPGGAIIDVRLPLAGAS